MLDATHPKSPMTTSLALMFFRASDTVKLVRLLWLTRGLFVTMIISLVAPGLNGYSDAFIKPKKPSLSGNFLLLITITTSPLTKLPNIKSYKTGNKRKSLIHRRFYLDDELSYGLVRHVVVGNDVL